MKKKHSLTLDDEFVEYCRLNSILDVENFAKKTFKRGFDIVKYGETPIQQNKTEEVKKVKNEEQKKPIKQIKQIKDNLYSE